MSDYQKYFFPLGVVAAIVGIWAALRKPNVGPTQSNQISPSASGLPNYTPQAVSYQVNPPQLSAPTQAQLLSDPLNTNPALPPNPNQTPPPYLAFNFGPGQDLSKIPLTPQQIQQLNGQRPNQSTPSCGNCNSCSGGDCANDPNKSIFPDGRGGYMATNGRTLVQQLGQQDPSWPARASYNIAGSDIDPNALPYAWQTVPQTNATPAAPTQTLSPSSPGSTVVINTRNYSSINPNVTPVAGNTGNLSQFGNQTPKLNSSLISRLTGTQWTS